ncbi:MAG TPA: aminopeptidase, partial [Eubacteriaceae bacterium]|nr:aminopeptidase [Eubacteriaceae bacterium]
EEVFTAPEKTGVNGKVYGTKPLYYSGNLIDEFFFTFKDGEVVEYGAKVGEEVLKDMISMDEGAKYLGELALVPYDSPISNTKMLFKNTLFDENASCHLALGKAYPTCIENGENLEEKELENRGLNDSLIHVDFMFGHQTTKITAYHDDDETGTLLFENGNWA